MTGFNPDKDIPSLGGKVFFVTGGTAGLGRLTILNLAKHEPTHIYFSGRSTKSADSLMAEVRQVNPSVQVTFVKMDLASLADVKRAASGLSATMQRLDVVVCNAGIMAVPAAVSTDGYEIHVATNHLGHAMLLRHLLPVLESTAVMPGADVRIVTLTSTAWKGHPTEGISYSRLGKGYDGFVGRWQAYGQSKFANLLYAAELARRHPSILSVSIQPGIVSTGLVTSLGFWDRAMVSISASLLRIPKLTPEEGCHNSLWAAAVGKRAEMVNGGFYMPCGQDANGDVAKDGVASDPAQAKRLWEWTETALDKI